MNNKILVNVLIPILEEEYDIFIPVGKTVGEAFELIKTSVSEMTLSIFKEKNIEIFDSDGKQIDKNAYVKDSGLSNGSRVILIGSLSNSVGGQ